MDFKRGCRELLFFFLFNGFYLTQFHPNLCVLLAWCAFFRLLNFFFLKIFGSFWISKISSCFKCKVVFLQDCVGWEDYMNSGSKRFIDYLDQSLVSLVFDVVWLFLWGMNIVKGVADLIRRSSGGQTGESSSWSHGENLSAPSLRIRFGYVLV